MPTFWDSSLGGTRGLKDSSQAGSLVRPAGHRIDRSEGGSRRKPSPQPPRSLDPVLTAIGSVLPDLKRRLSLACSRGYLSEGKPFSSHSGIPPLSQKTFLYPALTAAVEALNDFQHVSPLQ